MSIIHGTYKSGHVELDSPVDWPEGVRVAVQPAKNVSAQTPEPCEKFGMSEEDWPTTKEGIEALIAEWNAIEPAQAGQQPNEVHVGKARGRKLGMTHCPSQGKRTEG